MVVVVVIKHHIVCFYGIWLIIILFMLSSLYTNIFNSHNTLGSRDYDYSHFTDDEAESGQLRDLPKAIQLLSSRDRV